MLSRIRRLAAGIKTRLLQDPLIQVVIHTIDGAGAHDVAHLAAGVAYYAVLSIFPLLLGITAVFGFFLPSVNLQNVLLKFVGDNVPGAAGILQQNIDNIIGLRGPIGIISIIILFWGASAMFGAVSLAINRAWNIRQYRRHFFVRKAGELGMTFGIGFLLLLSLGASAVISILLGITDLHPTEQMMINFGGRAAAFLLIMMVFLLLYKLTPHTRTYWRDVWPGALLTAVFFEIARTLFVIYLENFARYQLLYGSIASIIILLVWIYYSAFIIIMGAEFTYQYSRLRHPAPEK
jgi:membrane protein